MRLPVFDFTQSAWINVKEDIHRTAILAVRKASVWKKNIEEAEDRDAAPNNFVLKTNINPSRYSYSTPAKLAKWFTDNTPPQYTYTDKDFSPMNLVEANGQVFNYDIIPLKDGTLYTNHDNTEYSIYNSTGFANKGAFGITTDVLYSIPRIDLYTLINKHQIQNDQNVVDRQGNKLSAQAYEEMIRRVMLLVDGDMVYKHCINGEVLVSAVEERFLNTIIVKTNTDSYWFKSEFKYAASLGWSDVTSMGGSYFHTFKKTDSYLPQVNGILSARNPGAKVINSFVGESDEDREVYVVLNMLAKMLIEIEIVDDGKASGYYDSIPAYIHNDAIQLGLSKMADNAHEIYLKQQEAIEDAKSTPIGKILYEFGNLESLTDTDTSNMNEMWLSFRIQFYDNINTLKDNDRAMMFTHTLDDGKVITSEQIQNLERRVPMWRKYVICVICNEAYTTSDGSYIPNKIVGYIPNWEALYSAPPKDLMHMFQIMMTIEYDVPSPERKTNWFAIAIAIVITVVVAVFAPWGTTYSTTVLLGWIGVGSTIVASVAAVASELTGSKRWAKVAKVSGYIGAAASVLNVFKDGVIAGIKKYTSQMVQHAVKLANYGASYLENKELKKLAEENQAILDEIEEVEEIAASEQQTKDERIQNFIYTDNFEMKYTAIYNYDITYKYTFFKGR